MDYALQCTLVRCFGKKRNAFLVKASRDMGNFKFYHNCFVFDTFGAGYGHGYCRNDTGAERLLEKLELQDA